MSQGYAWINCTDPTLLDVPKTEFLLIGARYSCGRCAVAPPLPLNSTCLAPPRKVPRHQLQPQPLPLSTSAAAASHSRSLSRPPHACAPPKNKTAEPPEAEIGGAQELEHLAEAQSRLMSVKQLEKEVGPGASIGPAATGKLNVGDAAAEEEEEEEEGDEEAEEEAKEAPAKRRKAVAA